MNTKECEQDGYTFTLTIPKALIKASEGILFEHEDKYNDYIEYHANQYMFGQSLLKLINLCFKEQAKIIDRNDMINTPKRR